MFCEGRVALVTGAAGRPSPWPRAFSIRPAARMQALLLAQDQAWAHGVTLNVIAPGPVSGLPALENANEA